VKKSSRTPKRTIAGRGSKKASKKVAKKGTARASKKSSKKPAARRAAARPDARVALPSDVILRAAVAARDRLVAVPKWSAAYVSATPQEPLLVRGRAPSDMEYYLVEFRQSGRTTGLMIIDARTARVDQVGGIRAGPDAGAPLVFYRPEQIPALVGSRDVMVNDSRHVTISAAGVTVRPALFWVPCDQSFSPFQPLYVADHLNDDVRDVLYVRVDGQVYTSITQTGRGL
jgi:hypothetical protein